MDLVLPYQPEYNIPGNAMVASYLYVNILFDLKDAC